MSGFIIVMLNVVMLNVVLLSVVMMNVVMLGVVMLCVIMLNVMAPRNVHVDCVILYMFWFFSPPKQILD